MGAYSEIIWFTERDDLEPAHTTLSLLRLFGRVTGVSVVRYDREDTSWTRLQEEERDPGNSVATIPEMTFECRLRVNTVEEASSLIVPGVFVWCEPYPQEPDKIGHAVLREIPREISRGCALSSPSIGVGGFDIWDFPILSEDDEAVFYGRSRYYVSLSVHGLPINIREYEKMFLLLPEVQDLEHRIHSILGTLKRCFRWSS